MIWFTGNYKYFWMYINNLVEITDIIDFFAYLCGLDIMF